MVRSLLVAFAALFSAQLAVAQAPVRIDLNIPALKLEVWEGDERVLTYPIAVGMPGFDTPTGNYTISHAEWNPWWHPPTHRDWARNEKPVPPGASNPMGRVKLFFMPMYFIHGTPDGESIGTPASHGCVRMRNEDVIALARYLHERAAPQVTPEQLDRYSRPSSTTQRVNFQRDIEISIHYTPVVVERSEIFLYPDIYDRNAIHSESVYQALVSAGYDVSDVDYDDVRRLVDRARGQKAPIVLQLEEAFSSGLAMATE
jgi:murein L,D-transpeptidase YcbB/YkuD